VTDENRARRCPICGKPAREEQRTVVFHVARWAEGLPHVADRLRCTGEPPHEWEVAS
jgi:endogenous inhibitor of DNA gyrase (YacG/DUF329 family)